MDVYNSILFSTKNQHKKLPFVEAILLFLVFFFPGYYYQSAQFSFEVMFSADFHLSNLIFTVPQAALMLYILHVRNNGQLGRYGIHPFRLSILPAGLLTFLGVFLITMTLGAVVRLIGVYGGMELVNPAIPTGANGGGIDYETLFSSPHIPLFILLTSLIIGYFEELYFRVYLLTEFTASPAGTAGIVAVSSLLFALGHMYQGIVGTLGTFLIGTFLAYRYLRRHSWHEIAIAHGLYNFTMIMLIPALN